MNGIRHWIAGVARLRVAAGLVGAGLVATACGGGSGGGLYGGSSGTSAQGAQHSLSITSPRDGAEVSEPFVIHLSSDVPLGAPSTGEDHVHVYFDGNQNDYKVVGGTSYKVEGLSPGKHTIEASLRNADHSPAGASTRISVTVTMAPSGGTKAGGSKTGRGRNY